MNLNFKQAIAVFRGESSFTNMVFGARTIDSSPYNRSQIVKAYENGAELRLVIGKVVDSFSSIPIKWVDKNGDLVEDSKQEQLLKSPNMLQTQMQF